MDITTKVWITCKEHGDFFQLPVSHTHGGSGCPICARSGRSMGEVAVAVVLMDLRVWYESGWWHPTCRNELPLPFDFYLPTFGALIEFDGEQHSRPVRWPGMSDEEMLRAFEQRQYMDRLKNNWAQSNGYHLLRVSDMDRLEQEVRIFCARMESMDHGAGADRRSEEHMAVPEFVHMR